jgi:hypothetical protein
MPGWGPDTPWRQGHVLTAESAEQLGLSKKDEKPETIVLVISHDCDLAHDDLTAEPACEIIVGTVIRVDQIEGRYTEAKHPRRLQLPFGAGETKIVADFVAIRKQHIRKSDLGAPHEPAAAIRLTPDELSVLQRWLALRYRRSWFPTEFDKRMHPIKNKLGRIIDRTGVHITGIFFPIDNGENIERVGEDDVYALRIVLVLNSETDNQDAARAFNAARSEIKALFRREFKKGDGTKLIELEDVYPSSDELMTLRQSWRMRQWGW